jgi:formiminoglutamase
MSTRVQHTVAGRWPATFNPARLAAKVALDLPAAGGRRSALGSAPTGIALLGLPDDLGVRLNGGRTGASAGPSALRAALAGYGVGDPAGIHYPPIFDAGDVVPASGDDAQALAATHQRVQQAAADIVARGLFPVGIGGGHDLTYAFASGALHGHGAKGAGCVYFDAHLDVRETAGSGMPFRRLEEEGWVSGLTIIGQNTLANTRAHARWFAEHGGHVADDDVLGAAESGADLVAPLGEVDDLVVSFDLDAIDGAHAPGVSAVNPAGLTVREAARGVFLLAQHPALRCFDLMELCPAHDVPAWSEREGMPGRTARVAAHLLLTFMQGWKVGRLLNAPER